MDSYQLTISHMEVWIIWWNETGFLSSTGYVWMLAKSIEKKLEGNCIRMLWAIVKESWKQHPTKQQLHDHLPHISKTIQVRWTRYMGYCWRSKDKLISDILQCTPSYGCTSVGRPARTYLQQLYADTECSLEDLMGTMDDKDKWRKGVREIHARSSTWWW